MPDRPNGKKLLLGFVTVNLITGIVVGVFQMVVPLFALSLNATNTQIGLIRGVMGLGLLLTVIPAGFLVDHFGSKKLYLAGSICCTLVTIGVCLAANPFALIVLMGMYGFFRSLSLIATNAAFFSHLNVIGLEKAGWVNGTLSLGALAVGPFLGGYLAKYVAFSQIFKVVALLYPVPILLVIFFYREAVRRRDVADGAGRGASQLREFRELLKDRAISQLLLAEGLGGACSATFGVFIIVIIIRMLNLAPTVASALLTLQGGASIMVVFLAGPLVKRHSTSSLYLASCALASLGLLGLSLTASLPVIVLASAILGIGLGLIQLVNYSRIGSLHGEKGKISGLLMAAGGAGFTVGPLAAGLASEYLGNRLIFAAFVPIFLALGFMVALDAVRGEKQDGEPVMALEAIPGRDE
jgi:MFS family permease